MIYYAKSNPEETIKEHTNQLLERLTVYKELYQKEIPLLTERDWELLELSVRYHDVGKVDLVFQNKIRKVLDEPAVEKGSEYNIPHNYMSVMALPVKELNLSKDESRLVSQVIAFHHERDIKVDKAQIAEQYQRNVRCFKEKIEADLGVEIDEKIRPSKMNKIDFQNRIQPEDPLYLRYVLLKGLLHRLDHAASAHVPIELGTAMNVSEYVLTFFKEKLQKPLKPLQQFTFAHQDHHLVIVAQTGMGKTEAGLLWLGNKKGFFTLPLRVSINAMYKRITSKDNIGFSKKTEEYGEEATGLLHSTSLDYLYDTQEGNDNVLEKVHGQSKEFANKLIISTVDQVLKFPLYYLGFEKEFATMATSKLIIDELQAYDPKIAAVLVRAMTLIDQIGGSFLIMTATLPEFYYNALQRELKNSRLPMKYKEFIDDSVVRHHVAVRESSIMDEEICREICQTGKKKKVLVICNTVNRAREVYEGLKNGDEINVHLLHAAFIKRDRRKLEKEILSFASGDETGIWVTTQLVEASLDIDFDVLFSEMSTLDSQFQRYGRCNRKGSKETKDVNIHVLIKEVSGTGYVYHDEIYSHSLLLLQKHQKGILLESKKHSMVKELYNEERLQNSSFKKEFDLTLEQLKRRPHYKTKKLEAQEILRDIQQVQAIPHSFAFDRAFNTLLEEWQQAQTKAEKRKKRMEIEAYSVGVNQWKAKAIGLTEVEGMKGLYFIHCEYSSERGLLTNQESIIS